MLGPLSPWSLATCQCAGHSCCTFRSGVRIYRLCRRTSFRDRTGRVVVGGDERNDDDEDGTDAMSWNRFKGLPIIR